MLEHISSRVHALWFCEIRLCMCRLLQQQLSWYCRALQSITDIFEGRFVVKYGTMFARLRERSAAAVVSQILGPLPSNAFSINPFEQDIYFCI